MIGCYKRNETPHYVSVAKVSDPAAWQRRSLESHFYMKTKLRFLSVLLVFSATTAFADISPEKRQEIDRMLNLVGMQALADQMMEQMVTSFRATMKDVPPNYWDGLSTKFSTADFLERIVPLYDKYYSLEDLRAVNAFYSSKAGQRILKTLPQIMQESMAIGEAWGKEIGERVANDLKIESEKSQLVTTHKQE